MIIRAAASCSNFFCNFVDVLSLRGKITPEKTRLFPLSKILTLQVVVFQSVPGEKMFGLKRISKIISLTEPTSLQASRTALLARESPASTKICQISVFKLFCQTSCYHILFRTNLHAVAHSSKPPFTSSFSFTF